MESMNTGTHGALSAELTSLITIVAYCSLGRNQSMANAIDQAVRESVPAKRIAEAILQT